MFKSISIILLIFLSALGVSAQTVIKGKIVDKSSGLTMIGTNVVIKGTTEGSVTDLDGKFTITTDKGYPITLTISFMGYKPIEYVVENATQKVSIKMEPDNVMLDAVEIVDSRISERQKQAPLTVESMDVIAIKEAPSGNFYESLGNMKGVDMTSASLGFKVINTRGFNSTSPVRSLQLIDGVDNQSPGLNFSLGNFLGASDLDVMKVDIIAGASSAFYGPGAFNGVINMTTKDPFTFPGLSASVKVGERDMTEYAVRWAQVLKNKEGKDKFGYKINAYFLKANDWEAENYDPIFDSGLGSDNPGGYDAVNRYGDEGSGAVNNDFSNPGGQFGSPGVGEFRSTGYNEIDLADYNTENLKLNGSFHYKIKEDLEAIFSSSYSQGTTIYQGENRFSLKNIQFYQNKLELKKKDKWFIRGYATNEDAGDSYDIVSTALRMQEATIDEADWNSEYYTYFRVVNSPKVRNLPGYPQLDDYEDLADWSENGYLPWIATQMDSLRVWHQQTRQAIDEDPRSGDPRYEPGTARFDSLFNDVTGRNLGNEGGSRFYDKSSLYHIQGEYKFTPAWFDVTVGGNMRWYRPDSRGTIFADTLEYTRINTDSGLIITDSSYRQITNYQYGAFVGVNRKFLEDKLSVTATLRMDKNENFDFLYSPAISFVYNPSEKHTLRASFSSGTRNPTLSDQFLFYDVGRAILLGNIDGYDSLVTTESLEDYLSTFNVDTLDYFDVDPIKPEQVRTVELGYRGMFKDKLYVDASSYFNWYTNFIGYQIGIDTEFDPFGNPADIQAYRIASNSKDIVTTQGFSVGLNYYLNKWATLSGNYDFNQLVSGDDDPLIPAFNTPKNKFNVGVSGREIRLNFIPVGHFGFGVNYKWIEGFLFEGSPQFTGNVDSYDLVDAQINYTVPKIHTTFKLGASNLLDNRVYQVYGGPRVGRLAYFSIIFDWRAK